MSDCKHLFQLNEDGTFNDCPFCEVKFPITEHPLYVTWVLMRQRCRDINHPQYKDYGGRGIKVCVEWEDFNIFVKQMWPKTSDKHTLDRLDNDQGYNVANCHWATRKQQANNTRRKFENIPYDE